MFDLGRLRLLRDLARRGTMIAVADAAGLTSSAVSQQLATLEREARTPLLERIGRRVRLTEAGQRLVAHAETILQAVDAAERDLSDAGGALAGVLQVACFSTYARVHLLPAVIRLRSQVPDLRIVLHELEPPDAIAALRDGRCDLAIGFTYSLAPRREVAGLVAQPLLDEAVRVVLPDAWRDAPDPLDLARLADADWIVGARQSDDREMAERACAVAGFAPRITHAIDDYDLLLRMVATGLGVGFAPDLAIRLCGAHGAVVRTPGGPPLRRRVEALTRNTLAASPAVRALLSELGAAG
jgi:DNA-binding transcriptional LysR family regulator